MEAPGKPSVVELWRPTLSRIPKTLKGNKIYVGAPCLWRPLGIGPACPVLNPALISSISLFGKR